MSDTNKQGILKIIERLGHRYDKRTVFFDWTEMFAYSIQNACLRTRDAEWERREKKYLNTMQKYSKEHQQAFPEMSAYLTEELEQNPFQDVLGEIYMKAIGGNDSAGQVFTPYCVAKLMAEISIPPKVKEKKDGFPIKIGDCACGGGVTFIAALDTLNSMGVKWQKDVVLYGNDIDCTCAYMSYIQLSLLGARAIIKQKDTLADKTFQTLVTPMEILYPVLFAHK